MGNGWSEGTRARSSRYAALAAAAVAAIGVLSAGCGTYEPEPEYPQNAVQYVQPPPPSATDPQVQAQTQPTAPMTAAAAGEVPLGVDPAEQEYSDTDPSALTDFKPVLEDHGQWVDDGTYGTVWVPSPAEVGTDFQPYVSSGHWSYSDEADYVWVSDYSWGWAPFHYGRWVTLPGYGWSWIPGRRYAGAWVNWRYGAGYDYVGWAPMGPSWYWWHGAPYGWGFGGYDYHDHYAFCERGHLYGGAGYVVRGPAARDHFGRTSDYTPAHPTVGGQGHVIAHPSVGHGPRPGELGNANVVVAPPRNNIGLARASAFAAPRTAVAAGAAAPASWSPGLRGPANAASIPRSGSVTAVASSPSYTQNGAPYRGTGAVASSPSNIPSRSVTSVGRPTFGGQPSETHVQPSMTRAQPVPVNRGSVPVAQARPMPSVRSPSYASQSPTRSSPVVHSSPSFMSHASSPSHVSSPSVSHSSPSHSAPSSRRR